MAKSDEILRVVGNIEANVDSLKKEDIPEIKEHLKTLNGTVQKHDRSIIKIKTTLSVLGTLAVLAIGGLSKWFGLW